MACEDEQEAFLEAYRAAEAAQRELQEVMAELGEAFGALERNCGYFGSSGFVIDPLDPGDPDYDDAAGPCPDLASAVIDAVGDYLPARYQAEETAQATKDALDALRDCQHRELGHDLA